VSAEEVANLFLDYVVKAHGMPEEIISDRDARFTSGFWQQLMKRMGSNLCMSTAFHPQSDGQTERMNRVLEDMLRHYVDPTQTDWDEHLPMAEFAVNNAYNESVKATPFFLNYGEHPRTPLDVGTPGKNESAEVIVKRVQDNIQQAKVALDAARQRQTDYVNKHRVDIKYEPGQLVMLSTKNLKFKAVGTKKLLPRWVGPLKIVRMVNKVAAKLQLPKTWRIHDVFHVSLLKHYQQPQGKQYMEPQPLTWLEGDPVYEVERILLHRDRRKGRSKQTIREFLVKWMGFGCEHNTWEPQENLTGCAEALQDYWKLVQ
jgi:hypothetical protein